MAFDRNDLWQAYCDRLSGIGRRWSVVINRRARSLPEPKGGKLRAAGIRAGFALLHENRYSKDVPRILDENYP